MTPCATEEVFVDTIEGQAGNDTEIIGDHRAANPSGASGDDDLFGNVGNDGLHGDSFAPTIDSGNGQDRCDGAAGTDTAANCEVLAGVEVLTGVP